MNFATRSTRALSLFVVAALLTFIFSFSNSTHVHAAAFIVNENVDALNGNMLCSLREAMTAVANKQPVGGCPAGTGNDTITFAPGLTIPINLALPTVPSGTVLTINGSNNTLLNINALAFQVATSATLNIVNMSSTGGMFNCFSSRGNLSVINSYMYWCSFYATAGNVTVRNSTVSYFWLNEGSAFLQLHSSTVHGGFPFTLQLGSAGALINNTTFNDSDVSIFGGTGPIRIYRSRFQGGGQAAMSVGNTSYLLIENSTFRDLTNVAIDVAGMNATQVYLRNNTFLNNSAAIAVNFVAPHVINMTNNILYSTGNDCLGATQNIVDGGGNTQISGSCPAGFSILNPQLSFNFVPQAGSPVIDTGVGGNSCPSVDFYNTSRPRDGNGDGIAICDRGAVERQ